jgi:hypothetical protein
VAAAHGLGEGEESGKTREKVSVGVAWWIASRNNRTRRENVLHDVVVAAWLADDGRV